MELATNLFTKGLLLDTHPMVLSADSLTDCLNGTIITMNGNEVILLNDMGNRKIDNAFLPAGYEPVGIKEYGGIIYLAVYNPLTGKGLLGSFPSPERKFGKEDIPESTLDFYDFIVPINNSTTKYKVKKNSIIIPLTEKILLHAGDKFKISSSNINSFLDLYLEIEISLFELGITYYKKENEEYVIEEGDYNSENTYYIKGTDYLSPKDGYKNLFTFKIGILNSLNEFIDITNTLLKGKNGYFIDSEGFNILNDGILDDKELLKERNSFQDLNTYSYKIVSPLYLKAELNYIKSVNYSIYGDKIETNKYDLDIETFYTYDNNIDLLLYKPELYLDGVILPYEGQNNVNLINISRLKDESFDEINEYYNSSINYNFNFEKLGNNALLLIKHYIPTDFYGDDKKIYISEYDYSYDLNLSKLNSDSVDFLGWQYYNNIEETSTILRINLQTYPKRKNSRLHELRLKIYNIYDNPRIDSSVDEILLYSNNENTIPSGILNFSFNWNNIEYRKLYKCVLSYGYSDQSNSYTEVGYIDIDGFFITTKLLNGNFDGIESLGDDAYYYDPLNSNIKYIKYNYIEHKNTYIQDYRNIRKYVVIPKVIINSDILLELTKDSSTSSTGANYSTFSIEDTFKGACSINPTLSIQNEELYPSLLYTTNDLNSIFTEITKNIQFGELESNLIYGGGNVNLNTILNGQISENIITVVINNNWSGSCSNVSIRANNVITSFSDLLNSNTSLMSLRKPYFAIDSEAGRYYSITYVDSDSVDPSLVNTYNKRLPSGLFSISQGIISEFMTNNNNDLFILEKSGDDFVQKTRSLWGESEDNNYTENCELLLENFLGTTLPRNYYFRRIVRVWFQYDLGKYTPIILKCLTYENFNLNFDISVFYDIIKNYWSKEIPHYYVYDNSLLNVPSINLVNFADYYTYKKSIEFNIPCYLQILFTLNENIKVDNYRGIIEIGTYERNINERIYIGKVSSNPDFEDLFEKIKSRSFECVAVISENTVLTDSEGEFLNNQYVYKLDSNNKLKKCYIPIRKFTIGDSIRLPQFYYESYLQQLNIANYLTNSPDINGYSNVVMILLEGEERAPHNSELFETVGGLRFLFNNIPNIYEI